MRVERGGNMNRYWYECEIPECDRAFQVEADTDLRYSHWVECPKCGSSRVSLKLVEYDVLVLSDGKSLHPSDFKPQSKKYQ